MNPFPKIGPHQEPAHRESRRNRHPRHARSRRARPAHGRHPLARGSLLAASDQGRRELSGRRRQGSDRGLSRHCRHHPDRHRGARRGGASGLRLFVGEPGIRGGLRGGGTHFRRSAARHHAQARQQGRRAQPRGERRRSGDAGDAAASGGRGRRCSRMAREVGFPVMLKASWGGGGRGMRIVEDDRELMETVAAARREAKAAFGKDEVYLEKLVRRARHVEVQILGDAHGNLVHLWERDCTVQRRNQKVVERAPAVFLTRCGERRELCEAALKIGRAVQLPGSRHGRVPAGRRHRQVLLHRGQSAHPGRAHRHRVRDRHRSGEGADPHRGRRADRHPGERRAACRRKFESTPMPCNAG